MWLDWFLKRLLNSYQKVVTEMKLLPGLCCHCGPGWFDNFWSWILQWTGLNFSDTPWKRIVLEFGLNSTKDIGRLEIFMVGPLHAFISICICLPGPRLLHYHSDYIYIYISSSLSLSSFSLLAMPSSQTLTNSGQVGTPPSTVSFTPCKGSVARNQTVARLGMSWNLSIRGSVSTGCKSASLISKTARC